MFNKIAFVGLGLLGGSLAKRIREVFPNVTISAIARSKETIQYALENSIIDESSPEIAMVVHNAKLVIIATPLELIVPTVKKVIPHISEDTIVIDIGSAKNEICSSLKKYSKNFIGGHPMCGTEKIGIRNSFAEILDGAKFVLTPFTNTPSEKLKTLHDFIYALKMLPFILKPQEHDNAVAAISHLPYFVANTLLANARTLASRKLAASGFKSTTRVGESDPAWGKEIAKSNKKALLAEISFFQKNLAAIKKLITQNKYAQLTKLLEKNQQLRRSIYP